MKVKNNLQTEAGQRCPAFTCAKQLRWRGTHKLVLTYCLVILAALSCEVFGAQGSEKNDPNVVSETDTASVRTRHPRENTYIKRTWGVEIMFVREASGGYMLEFRYKVLDAKKAAPLFVRATKPVLIDVKTSARLQVPTPPTTGALRNSNMPIEGRTYWMFFANPGNAVKVGDRVSIEIGEFRVDDLVVQ